jgi:EPS-associated MarR family transcriptional regulator
MSLQGGSVPSSGICPAKNSLDHVLFLKMLSDEMRYKLMRVLYENPEMSQREIAHELGVSLGKVNFCLQALIKKGFVKMKNFSANKNKAAYMYVLTPHGIEQRANLTVRFLKAKTEEYEALRLEIEQMRHEVERQRVK